MKLTKLLTAFFMLIFFSSIGISACVINLESPLDNAYVKDSTPDFIFNVTGGSGLYNVTLFINDVEYLEDLTIVNNTNESMTPTTAIGMQNEWYLYAINTTSGENCTSAIRNLDYGTTNFEGMSKLIGMVQDIVSMIPDLIRLAIYGGILTIVATMALVVGTWVKKKGIL